MKFDQQSIAKALSSIQNLDKILFFPTLDSTQDYAKANVKTWRGQTVLILADGQTTGHGQCGRSWESPPGVNLYFTLVVFPNIPIQQAPFINVACGLGLQKAFKENLNLYAMIKWPNDLYLHGKKFAGLLSELVEVEAGHHAVLIGMGINVNCELKQFSESVQKIATSLKIETGKRFDRNELLAFLLPEVLSGIQILEAEGIKPLLEDFKRYSSFVGQKVRFVENNQEILGKVFGLSEEGWLEVVDEKNRLHQLVSGEVYLCS